MSEHTKGPWVIDGTTVYSLQHSGWNKGEEVLENRFSAHVQRGRYCPLSEVNANANLIAATPDLLEALEVVIRSMNEEGLSPWWLEAVELTITKARGETT